MSEAASMIRLLDLPAVADAEHATLRLPLPGPGEPRPPHEAIDALSRTLFGLTPDEADALERPDDWDWIEDKPAERQAALLNGLGWDVLDGRMRPLRLLAWLIGPLALAARGVAGHLPEVRTAEEPSAQDLDDARWASRLEAEARGYRKR